MAFDMSNEKHAAALLAVLIALVFLVIIASVMRSAHSAPNTNLALRVIEYKNDVSRQGTMKVVYDHRRIANLDRNVTELQTKLGSAGWVPVNDGFAKTDAVPGGCVIHVLVSEKESSTVQSPYALEGCDASVSLASILFAKRSRFCFVGFSDEQGNCTPVSFRG
jgi:hypothetical protein